jgi:CheY-like chemotaxis protein
MKILIVEDDEIIAESMKTTFEQDDHLVVDIVETEERVFESLHVDKPDVIIMDIRLGRSGFEGITIAKNIRKLYTTPIIYVTQFDDKEIFKKAKESFPQYYITKPYNDEMLLRSVELAAQNNALFNLGKENFMVKDGVFILTTVGGAYKKLMLKAIVFIKAFRSSCEIFYDLNQPDLSKASVSMSSNKLVPKMAYAPIIRVHNSFYVNAEKIDSVHGNTIYIAKLEIPIGDTYRDDVLKRLIILKRDKI